jgi:uroporphyrin-III C-methyltransferase/precorrin-2 dehydrogenase/sirohydrochlorin ferrochelatase
VGFSYPVTLDVGGRLCVVLGGGEVAEHKAHGLLEAGARVRVVAPDLTAGLEELARRGTIEAVRRTYAHGDLAGAFVAVAATDDPETNACAYEEAEERRVLMNAVDDVAHCHFAAPSVVRRGDLLLAISTAGEAPALAKRLREELSQRFGPEWGTLVDVLAQARREALSAGARADGFDLWARRWGSALDEDLVGLVREGRTDEARRRVVAALLGRPSGGGPGHGRRLLGLPGKVWIVGAGPGDPGLITLRGRQALESADVVVYDRLVHPELVAGRTAIFVGKRAGGQHAHQREINALLVRLARRGKAVVRLKGGDPFVFGRGGEEAEALAAAGVRYEVVPAPTSAIAALAYAGIPVTDRRVASSVAIVSGHSAGDRDVDWRRLAASVDTIVVLMGVGNLDHVVRELIAGGRDPRTPAAIVENGTLPGQRVVTADLGTLPASARRSGIRSPAAIVIGEVVSLRQRIAWFEGASESAASLAVGS